MKKNIGIAVSNSPSRDCSDKNCAHHGFISVRGREFTGNVVKPPFNKTATIEFGRLFYLPKYERYEKRRTRVKVHVPECVNVKSGDEIKIIETRPISKTKNFVVVEVIK